MADFVDRSCLHELASQLLSLSTPRLQAPSTHRPRISAGTSTVLTDHNAFSSRLIWQAAGCACLVPVKETTFYFCTMMMIVSTVRALLSKLKSDSSLLRPCKLETMSLMKTSTSFDLRQQHSSCVCMQDFQDRNAS